MCLIKLFHVVSRGFTTFHVFSCDVILSGNTCEVTESAVSWSWSVPDFFVARWVQHYPYLSFFVLWTLVYSRWAHSDRCGIFSTFAEANESIRRARDLNPVSTTPKINAEPLRPLGMWHIYPVLGIKKTLKILTWSIGLFLWVSTVSGISKF